MPLHGASIPGHRYPNTLPSLQSSSLPMYLPSPHVLDLVVAEVAGRPQFSLVSNFFSNTLPAYDR